MEERERNHKLKIYEKNRPSREGCLKRLCEDDIEQSMVKIHPKIQKKINQAEAAGFTIPVERPRNKENRYKMIDKKREMFLINQMIQDKREKTIKLEEYAQMRKDGLNCSQRMLSEDIRNFVKFFKENTDEANQATKNADCLADDKNQKIKEYKSIEGDCASVKSKCSKNIEIVTELNDYKIFLDYVVSDKTKRDESQGKGFQNDMPGQVKETKEKSETSEIEVKDHRLEERLKRFDILDDVPISLEIKKFLLEENQTYTVPYDDPKELIDEF